MPAHRSSLMTVRPEWIDFNGHLNMAYYNVLFDQAADDIYPEIGFGPDYQKTGCTTYVVEFHVCYIRELHQGDQVYVDIQLIDYDEKRFHLFMSLHHEDGWLAATGEGLTLHVDQSGPHVTPMPQHILEAFGAIKKAQGDMPLPERAGRRISLKKD